MKPKIYFLGKPEDGFGWGVCNTNLVHSLREFCDVIVDTSAREVFDAPAFVPITDNELTPIRKVRAPKRIGYCFTEWPIGEHAKRNARQFDVIFAGSDWNTRRLAECGIAAQTLHQGIDFERFKVAPPSERKGFVVFSGGKFEYRKGQDYVIAAMRRFLEVRKDAVLLAAWHNIWPQSAQSMSQSPLLTNWSIHRPMEWLPEFPDDIRPRVIQVPLLRNEQTPAVYAAAHVGLFPNRCEAGTNLVMCEFMACGRHVIATNHTGHADVLPPDAPIKEWYLSNGSYDAAGWFNPNVSDIISQLEQAYQRRDELPALGLECRKLVERFTWRDCALKIVAAAGLDSQLQARAPE